MIWPTFSDVWQVVAEVLLFHAVAMLSWYLLSVRFCRLFYNDTLPRSNPVFSHVVFNWFSNQWVQSTFPLPYPVAGTAWHAHYLRAMGAYVGRGFFSPTLNP